MALKGVLRPGHVSLRVLEMEPALKHYTEWVGLIETDRDDQGRVYLKGWDEHDKFCLVLQEADRPGMEFYAFKVLDDATLDQYEKRLNDYGVETRRVPAGDLKGCGERVQFTIPSGHLIELFAQKDQVGNGLPLTNPDVWPDGLKGIHPTRMDHCLFNGDSVPECAKLFTEVLDFDLTEKMEDPDGNVEPEGDMVQPALGLLVDDGDVMRLVAAGQEHPDHVAVRVFHFLGEIEVQHLGK